MPSVYFVLTHDKNSCTVQWSDCKCRFLSWRVWLSTTMVCFLSWRKPSERTSFGSELVRRLIGTAVLTAGLVTRGMSSRFPRIYVMRRLISGGHKGSCFGAANTSRSTRIEKQDWNTSCNNHLLRTQWTKFGKTTLLTNTHTFYKWGSNWTLRPYCNYKCKFNGISTYNAYKPQYSCYRYIVHNVVYPIHAVL